MASNAKQLNTELAKRQTGTIERPRYAGVESLLKKYEEEIVNALPKHVVGEQFVRLILQEFRLNPKLIQCSEASILGAVMTCARLGLEPGPLGLAYIIPYDRSVNVNGQWQKIPEAQFQGGYRGYVQLAYRSGQVANIVPYTVNANDFFEWQGGHDNRMIHKITDWQNRGDVLGYYVVVEMKDGNKMLSRPWSVGEIERHRIKHAQTRDAKKTPAWEKSYDRMAAKTVFRDMVPWMPLSTELIALSQVDERTVNITPGSAGEIGELLAGVDYTESEVIDAEETAAAPSKPAAENPGPDYPETPDDDDSFTGPETIPVTVGGEQSELPVSME